MPVRENKTLKQEVYRHIKRLLDVVGSLIGLLLLFLLFPFLATAIKVDSPGPIFFIQTRVGQYGRRFKFVKFRTMVVDAHHKQWELDHFNETGGVTFKMSHDPRVTRLGRLLRRTSLDEMPQFWNVLRGEMSLVGPRPPLLGEVERYDAHQRARMSVPQGMTGLWQVRGRSGLRFGEMADLDVQYALHANLKLDLHILWLTLPAVLLGRGAR
jgi:lipopolysaccharide/colanic/teichoic acid biosynthesis glycosyltransferase